jgi:predicted nucleic-acid-binding protein
MKIIADTNVLLRYFLGDDPAQYRMAVKEIKQATAVCVTNQTLCEIVWVLRNSFGVSRNVISALIRELRETENFVVDSGAMNAGLATVEAGADFADGVIAYEGRWLGGETFVSFDRKAVTALEKQGLKVKLLG